MLGELRQRPGCCRCTPRMPRARGLATDDPVRVFNELGEVHCPVAVTTNVRPGTVSLSKGLWRKSTYNGSTANALAPDTLTDLGGGACFNDARVQVALLGDTDESNFPVRTSSQSAVTGKAFHRGERRGRTEQ